MTDAAATDPHKTATHDVRGHFPYHHYAHPTEHSHDRPADPTETGLRAIVEAAARSMDEWLTYEQTATDNHAREAIRRWMTALRAALATTPDTLQEKK